MLVTMRADAPRRGCSTGALGSASRSPALEGPAPVRRLRCRHVASGGELHLGLRRRSRRPGPAAEASTRHLDRRRGVGGSVGVPTPLAGSASKITRHAGSTDAGSAFQRDRISSAIQAFGPRSRGSVVLTRTSIRRRAVGSRSCGSRPGTSTRSTPASPASNGGSRRSNPTFVLAGDQARRRCLPRNDLPVVGVRNPPSR